MGRQMKIIWTMGYHTRFSNNGIEPVGERLHRFSIWMVSDRPYFAECLRTIRVLRCMEALETTKVVVIPNLIWDPERKTVQLTLDAESSSA